jgi:hypothetical protein
MTCKKLRTKARWEQDKWLSYLSAKNSPNVQYANVVRRLPTEQERMDFLRYDSHGGEIPADNIILAGKRAAVVADTEKGATNSKSGGGGWFPYADELYEIYMDPKQDYLWVGGFALMEDYLRRVCGIAPLRKAFGDEVVRRWLAAFLWSAFGWPDLVAREYAGFYCE